MQVGYVPNGSALGIPLTEEQLMSAGGCRGDLQRPQTSLDIHPVEFSLPTKIIFVEANRRLSKAATNNTVSYSNFTKTESLSRGFY